MYTIITGEVAVIGRSDRGDPVEFCRQGPGSNIGIIELAFGHHCVADVVVTTPTVKMLRVDRHDFENSPKSEEIRNVVTRFVEEDDTFVVYRARHMIPAKSIDIPSRKVSSSTSKQPAAVTPATATSTTTTTTAPSGAVKATSMAGASS
ncbi:protein kinase, putative [Bodo saltans]|uniref:Protein kinase, putative n=1 Tax=Bodo saltans TaxID=75058 RepID=A0A0S4INX4_BODSA|nr:protein kinase, putative [Bodo saltans]|eukprot:CUE91861.1 protein kinase, putative [Bodo saltans]